MFTHLVTICCMFVARENCAYAHQIPFLRGAAANKIILVSMSYNRNCLHGGPVPSVIHHLLPKLQLFQETVLRDQDMYRDEQSLVSLLAEPKFAELKSHQVAHVFMSEAVDCYSRSEDIAHHWFCTGILISAAVHESSQFQDLTLPQSVLQIIAASKTDLATALWRCIPCTCIDAPKRLQLWEKKTMQKHSNL